MKITAIDRKSSHHDRGSCFLHLPFFLLQTHFSFAAKEKLCCDHCFPQQIRPQNTVQLNVLRDYLSGRIGFSLNNKCHPLPILYTLLVRVRKFQSLLFYSELNEVHSSYF